MNQRFQTRRMGKHHLEGSLLFAVGACVLVLMGLLWTPNTPIRMIDFDAVYYASQTALQHSDPYAPAELERVYSAGAVQRQGSPLVPSRLHAAVSYCVNLPTALFVMAPLALLPWSVAHALWLMLIIAGLIFSSYLVCDVALQQAPRLAGLLVAILLFGSQIVLEAGNAAGIAVSLCVIAVWCFVRNRYVVPGLICMAISLMLKPQDTGFIWLLFLLAGGVWRKRAAQSLILSLLIAIPAVLWIDSVSPSWVQELAANLKFTSAAGQGNNPASLAAEPAVHASMIVSLQTVTAVFTTNPKIYNLLAYLVCVPLLIIWAVFTCRRKLTREDIWLALTVIAPLSILPVYHRQHDTCILLLCVPGCAILWARRGRLGKLNAVMMVATCCLTGNIALQIVGTITHDLRTSHQGLVGALLTAFTGRPAPLMLLAASVCALICYVRTRPAPRATTGSAILHPPHMHPAEIG